MSTRDRNHDQFRPLLSDKLLSETISNMRFPLIVGVVLIHAKIPTNGNIMFSTFQQVVSDLLPSPCVPLFFVISSFLFFWKESVFDKNVYSRKLKSRLKSLLVPYLVWNGIAIVLFAVAHILFPGLINPDFENVPRWRLYDYFAAFWNGSSGQPINYPLWFVRNLIVMIILSPVFYILVYKTGAYRYVCFIVLLVIHVFFIQNGWITAAFYFFFGALLAKDRYMLYSWLTNKRFSFVICSSSLLFCSSIVLLMLTKGDSYLKTLYNIERLLGVFVYLLFFIVVTLRGNRLPSYLEKSSFFIYLYHSLALLISGRSLLYVIKPNSFFMLSATFFLNVSLIVLVGLLIYCVLDKYASKVLIILTGRR